MVSRLVIEFLQESVEHLFSLFGKIDRANLFNELAK